MQRKMKFRLVFPVLLLVTAALACQAVAITAGNVPRTAWKASEAAAPPVSVPDTVQPAAPVFQPGPATLDLQSLSADLGAADFIQAYRMEVNWTGSNGAPQNGTIAYLYQQQSTPSPSWTLLFVDETRDAPSIFENAIIGPFGFSATPDNGCQVVDPARLKDQNPRRPFADLFDALTGAVDNAGLQVLLGGEPADLYLLDASNFKDGAAILLHGAPADENGEFSTPVTTRLTLSKPGATLESAKLYLVQQGGYVGKLELTYNETAGQGDAPLAQPGSPIRRTLIYEAVPTGPSGDALSPPAICDSLTPQGDHIQASYLSPAP